MSNTTHPERKSGQRWRVYDSDNTCFDVAIGERTQDTYGIYWGTEHPEFRGCIRDDYMTDPRAVLLADAPSTRPKCKAPEWCGADSLSRTGSAIVGREIVERCMSVHSEGTKALIAGEIMIAVDRAFAAGRREGLYERRSAGDPDIDEAGHHRICERRTHPNSLHPCDCGAPDKESKP